VKKRGGPKGATTLRLKPADPFELIRWLARSQSDPRKAVAELVQNSLDANARVVIVRRHRVRGAVCLSIQDDGEGVLPDLERYAALEHLATHVGHSRKMGLDPATRAQQVIAGKYGVGLLGFWSVGRKLEMRTRVSGSDVLALRLEEDSPRRRS
jgi:HSP90 family molecular chaperone